jgi:hypothetical protein
MAQETEPPDQKLGAGHAKAMLRAGAKELAQVLPAFPGQGVQPIEEPGLAGNLTPQEIVNDKKTYDKMLEGYAAGGVHGREAEKGIER